MDWDLKTVTKNINRLTNKEKITFIETLLGISGQMAKFLVKFQEKCPISLPADIHYMILIAFTNLNSLSSENNTGEVVDFSLRDDSYKAKLIDVLKQLNEIYKEELNER
jgi:hypothetical protein